MRLLAFKESDNSCQKTTVGAYIVVWIAANMISCNKYGMFVNLIIKSSIRTEEKEHEEKSWLCFYEYAPVFWNSGHGGVRSGEKAGFYTENHYS